MSTDDRNGPDGKRRDLLKAGAAAGVAAVTGGIVHDAGVLKPGGHGRHD